MNHVQRLVSCFMIITPYKKVDWEYWEAQYKELTCVWAWTKVLFQNPVEPGSLDQVSV